MRKITLICLMVLAQLAVAQAPEGINYQAVARSSAGSLITNSALTVRVSLYSGIGGSTLVYQETHGVSTNAYGLFTLKIGKGAAQTGTFSGISWGSDEHHLKIEVDNGSGFIDLGQTQLMSVPYALYAETSGSGGGASVLNDLTDVNTSGASVNQVLSWNGTEWVPITTSGGTVYTAGSGLGLTGTTFTNTAPDQTVTLTGGGATTISGTYPNFNITSTDNNTTYNAGSGLSLSGTTFNALNSSALWNANSLHGRTVSPTTPSSGQALVWNGSSWAPATVSGGSSPWTVSGSNIYRNTGNVGIGTASPTFKLDIVHTATTANDKGINVLTTGHSVSTGNSYGIRSEVVGNGARLNMGVLGAAGGFPTATGTNYGGYFMSSATGGDNSYGLLTRADGGANVRNYGIYCISSGAGTFNIGALLISDSAATSDNYGLYALAENAGSGAAYGVYGDATANTDYAAYFNGNVEVIGTFNNPSDQRLKADINPLSNSLEKVKMLNVYTYNFDAKGEYQYLNLPSGKQYGFLAQEIETVFPELVRDNKVPSKGQKEGDEVSTSDATYKSVNNVAMIPILTKAMQEQQELIEKQQQLINLLEQRIENLENKE